MSVLSLLEPAPRPLWPLGLLRNLEDGAGAFGVLSLFFEIDGAGSAVHYSDQEASDEDLEDSGSVLGRILAWPTLTLGFDIRAPRLGLPQFIVDIEDADGTLEEILRGLAARTALNVEAWIRIGATDQGAGLWPIRWTGRLVDWMNGGEDVLRLVLQHNHGWATRPLVQHRFLPTEFPSARKDTWNKPIPIAVGCLDSRGQAPFQLYDNPYGYLYGAVPAYVINTLGSEWRATPTLGYVGIPRVWLEDVLLVEGTDYDLAFETISGYGFRTIQFASDPGAGTVRCDIEGYDSRGDGTGRPLRTVISQLGFLAVQYGAFGGRGPGLAQQDSAGNVTISNLFDSLSMTEADDYLQGHRRRPRGRLSPNEWTHGRESSAYFSTPAARVIDAINSVCLGTGVYPYWNEAGKVAFGILDHRMRRTYHDMWTHWVRDEDLLDGQVVQEPSGPRPVNQVRSAGLVSNDIYSPLGTLTVQATEEDIPNPWARGPLGQTDLIPYATTQDSGWTETGGGTDPHDSQAVLFSGPDTVYSSAGTAIFRVKCRLADGPHIPQGVPVAVEVWIRAKGAGTVKAGVYIGGVAYYDANVGDITLTADWTNYRAATFLLNPDTTTTWLSEDLNPDLLEVIVSSTGGADVRGTRARTYCLDGGGCAALVRERLARKLLISSVPTPISVVVVGMARGGIRPGDPFSISARTVKAGPGGAEDAEGWGLEPEEARLHVLCSSTWDPLEATMTLRAVDAHNLPTPLWAVDVAAGLAPHSPGIVRLGSWQAGPAWSHDGRRFSRPTADDGDPTGEDTITAPWGSSAIIAADHERYTSSGLHLKELNTSPTPDVSPDVLTYVWRHDQQVHPIDGGTQIWLVTVDALTAGQLYTIFRCGSDFLHVDIVNDVVRFRRRVDGTDYDAEVDLTDTAISAGNAFAVAIRWTPGRGGLKRADSDGNEEDVPPYTLSLWVRPADETFRATDVTAVQGYPGDLGVGHDAGTDILRGHRRLVRSWRRLLTDEEIEAYLETLTQ